MTLEVPDTFRQRFQTLLDDLEKNTGNCYTVTIRQLGIRPELVLKPFDQRNGYRIENLQSGYDDLNGTYRIVGPSFR